MTINFYIRPGHKISGDIHVSGDKSISHRAIILSSVSNNVTDILNLCVGEDVLNTIAVMRALGVKITVNIEKKSARVCGVGLHGLMPSLHALNCGNSGTAMRLLCGLLSAQPFDSVLLGDESLMRRPMLRVAEPLRLMGAKINLSSDNTAPIEIMGNQNLIGIEFDSIIPSAQVKSAVLLASLYAKGETVVHEKIPTRDHTEKMLAQFYSLSRSHSHSRLHIPGDMSSAAFFIVAACITKHSDIMIRQIGINPFRTGMIDILKLMGATIEIANETFFGSEPVADIRVKYAPLQGIEIPQALVSRAIDEFPVLFIAAATATGNTLLRGAKELRVKESDRITAMVSGFSILGVKTIEYDDGILIFGNQVFQGGRVDSFGDHRVAMAFAVAANIAKDDVFIDNCDFIKTSFPNFVELANQVGMKLCCQFP